MATFGVGGGATGAATSTRALFVRNATGLVRSWATFDAFIYSFFSINLVTLGWYIFSFGPITQGNGNLVTAIAISNNGYMVASVVVAGFAALVIAAGMKVYARVQKFCFFGGMLGLLSMFVVLLVSDHNAFVSGFNHFATAVFGIKGDAYAQTVAATAKAGFMPVPFTSAALGPSMALIPLVLFFNLWPNWGATLYGEVRGAGDFRRNLRAMSFSVVATAILALVFLGLIAKVVTSTFYNDANFAFWSAEAVLPVWP